MREGKRGLGSEGKTVFRELEEPFALLHAITLEAIWQDRCREKLRNTNTTAHTTTEILEGIKRKLQRLANHRRKWVEEADAWKKAKEETSPIIDTKYDPHSIETFDKAWILSGIAKITKQNKYSYIQVC